jgi:predicted RNA binding protein YcfA (HicA-like mRNA interferase family)
MSRAPRITGPELVKALERVGFSVARSKGSHRFLTHSDGRRTVVPVHSGK